MSKTKVTNPPKTKETITKSNGVTKPKPIRKGRKGPSSKDFINNATLLEQVKLSKVRMNGIEENGPQAMTDQLALMFNTMVERYANRPNFMNYSWKDEFMADALVTLCNKWYKFDETRFSNAFAYYTTVIHRCFLSTLEKETKQTKIKDRLLEEMGMNPSLERQAERDEEEL